jgi:hypothetical protein
MIYDGPNTYQVHATVATEASCEHGRSAGRRISKTTYRCGCVHGRADHIVNEAVNTDQQRAQAHPSHLPSSVGAPCLTFACSAARHAAAVGGATTPGETAAGDLCLKPSQYWMLQPGALDTMDLGQSSVVDPPDTPNTVPHQIPPLHGSGNLCSDGQLIDLPSQGSSVQQQGGGWRLTIRRSLDVAQPGAGSSPSVRQLLLRRPSADIIDAIRLGKPGDQGASICVPHTRQVYVIVRGHVA